MSQEISLNRSHSKVIIFLLLFVFPFFFLSCQGIEYVSKRQGEGIKQLQAKNYPTAVEAFEKAVANAEEKNDVRDVVHLKSLLGWTWSEAGDHAKGEKILLDAVKLGDDNNFLAPLYRARLSVVASKSGNYKLAQEAGEKALTQEASRWKEQAQLEGRDEIIDFAVPNHGLPPDVDMIRTVTMAESALAVTYLVTGEEEKARKYGEAVVRHEGILTSIMKMAPELDRMEFYRGIAVGAAAASRANLAAGNDAASKSYKQKSIDYFKLGGVEVQEGNLLAAYIQSTAKPRIAETGKVEETSLLKQAEALYGAGKYREARDTFEKAYNDAKASGRVEEAASAAAKLGWLLAELGKYPQATRLLEESVALLPKQDVVSTRYAMLAAIESRVGNHFKAEEYVKKAFDVLYLHRKNMFKGKDLDAVIDAAMKDPGLPPDVVLMKAVTAAEGARTTLRYFRGDYPGAVVEGERAVRHFKDIEMATSYAPLWEQLSYYEGAAFSALVTGDAAMKTGDIAKAKEYLNLARTYFAKAKLDYGDVIAEGLLGYAAVLEGDYRKGGEAFTKTLRRIDEGGYEELKWHIRSVMGSYLLNEAREIEKSLEETSDADLRTMAQAIVRDKREKSKALDVIFTGNRLSPLLDKLENAEGAVAILEAMKATARFLKELSYDNYREAIENMESIRADLETDLNKRAYLANKEAIFSDFIVLSTELYGAARGFEALERFKAKSLVDLLASREIAYRNGSLVKELAAIKTSFGEESLAVKKEGQTVSSRNAENKAVEGYRGVIVKLRKKEPELASLVSASFLSVKDVQRLLPEGLALVEYFMTQGKSYIWVLKHNDISVTVTNTGKETVQEKVRSLREAILRRKSEETRQAEDLYRLLVAPVEGKIASADRLLFVPFDALHHLPFGVLHDGSGYLVERFPITTSPSASVLHYALNKHRKMPKTLFALGNPDLGDPAYDLPFAEAEVKTISGFYPDGKTLLRANATEGTAKREAGDFDVLHFASHAEFNAVSPLASGILLARDATDDGRLEAREIFSLDLHPSLVTLSACQTGLGQITGGDEIIGMNRAFIYAGAPSILSSLWSVSDESTAKLMGSFYRNLQTEGKDAALRDAQIALIHSTDFNRPFFWAPFYLSGDWE